MSDLKFLSLSISHPGARERAAGAVSQVRLNLATEKGRVREVILSEDELLTLADNATSFLVTLRKGRA